MARKLVQDDKELLHLSQVELKKLQRQYRIMEGDKNSYASEIKCYLIKQRKIIETLNNEEKNLIEKISIEKPSSGFDVNNQWKKDFSELLKNYEKYLYLIKQKKDTGIKLDKKIRSLEDETKVLSFYGDSKMIHMKESIEKSTKHVETLQNKLYNETVKYDKALAENSFTREEVNSLLKDRARFNDLYKKSVMKLNTDKKKLLALIEKATSACEQRDEADEKLKSTLNKDHQEAIAQKHKMRELNRQLDHLIQLKEFLSLKGQKRILVDLEEKKTEKKQQKMFAIENFAKKHTRILEQIKEFCSEQNTERLPAIFIKQEEENFAFFNYVNEINNEVEILQDEVKSLTTSLAEQKKISVLSRREGIESFETLRKELDTKKDLIGEEKEKLASTLNILNVVFTEMENVFLLFKHGGLSLVHLLGEHKISSSNVNLFLDMMEKKVDDFLINSQ